MTNGRDPKHGVTQLELLVSLAVMALISVGLAQAFSHHGLFLQQSSDVRDFEEVALTEFELRKAIESIPVTYGQQTARDVLRGTQQRLEFRTSLGADTSHKLEMSDGQAYYMDASGEARPMSVASADFQISYFGQRQQDATASWHIKWDDAVAYPKLIKIEWDQDKGTIQPPLTLAPGYAHVYKEMSRSSLLPPR